MSIEVELKTCHTNVSRMKSYAYVIVKVSLLSIKEFVTLDFDTDISFALTWAASMSGILLRMAPPSLRVSCTINTCLLSSGLSSAS